jgi:competence protein ComEC
MTRTFTFALSLAAAALLHGQAGNLDIYWVDVEGGASTLIVTPSGQSLLVDAGNPTPDDRDSKRVFEATKMAGLKKIDMLVTTHYHGDHVGGEVALSKMIPIEKFYDHGDSIEAGSNPNTTKLWEDYKTISKGKRTILKPGDKIPLNGVDVRVVSANGEVIAKPVNGGGGSNTLCKDAQHKDADPSENARSVGFLLTYGKFKFLDIGDLTWEKELLLACPENKLGKVTLVQATHHGFVNDISGPPALYWALQPQVVVVNNSGTKGLGATAYETIAKSPAVEGIWQIHRSVRTDAAHNTSESMIANLDEPPADKGLWIKASVSKDGKFTLTNGRNNFSKSYTAR